jgi:sec-independent protein translocase protein TatA
MSMFVTMAIGAWQIAVVVLLVILLFGAKKIPEMMKGMGRGVKEFKDAVSKDYSAEESPKDNKKIEE